MTAPARATLALVLLHGGLLMASLPDYFVSIDSGYHVSLARLYGEHGAAWWDPINFGPQGRPNLQGPLMHMAVGYLGRVLGGDGMDYVLANALLGFAQWAAAIFTVWFLARRYGGDYAALFGVALLSGTLFASISFAVGIPSGWIFIFSAWAAWHFVEGRYALAAAFTCAACYTHLAGFAMAPVAVCAAATLTRRWRALVVVGAAVAVLTAPYTLHFLRYREWYRGRVGDEAWLLAPLIYLPAAFGIARLLRRPREHPFLLACLAGPAVWLLHSPKRFLLQAPLVLAVIGAIELVRLRDRIAPRWRSTFTGGVVALATIFPFTLPAIAFEAMWVFGPRSPRMLDWGERRDLAAVLSRDGLNRRLVNAWNPTQCISLAVFAPMSFERGHWVEVQPVRDPARDLSAGVKVYVLPVPPDDAALRDMSADGFVAVHGGTRLNSIVTLTGPAPLEAAARNLARTGAIEAEWLARHAVNNRMPSAGDLLSFEAVARYRARAGEQRTRAGRIEIAIATWAYALEPHDPRRAFDARRAANGFGAVANLLGDEATLDFRSDEDHRRLQANLAEWAREVRCFETGVLPTSSLDAVHSRLMRDYLR